MNAKGCCGGLCSSTTSPRMSRAVIIMRIAVGYDRGPVLDACGNSDCRRTAGSGLATRIQIGSHSRRKERQYEVQRVVGPRPVGHRSPPPMGPDAGASAGGGAAVKCLGAPLAVGYAELAGRWGRVPSPVGWWVCSWVRSSFRLFDVLLRHVGPRSVLGNEPQLIPSRRPSASASASSGAADAGRAVDGGC